jgi:hypothetical protein
MALAPLLSHATARPRPAGTSFVSQPSRAAGGSRARPTGTSQRYDPDSLPSRPGPHHLPEVSIRRLGRVNCLSLRYGELCCGGAAEPRAWPYGEAVVAAGGSGAFTRCPARITAGVPLGRGGWCRPVAAATAISCLGSGESMSSRAQVPAQFRERAVASRALNPAAVRAQDQPGAAGVSCVRG